MSSDVAVQEKETIVSKENTDHEEKASHDVTKATDITIPKATRRGRERKAEKQAETEQEGVVTIATASVDLKVSPKGGRPVATEVKISNQETDSKQWNSPVLQKVTG